jgi:divalent metal cation (Fe/Co/Zn/Cd) transporter
MPGYQLPFSSLDRPGQVTMALRLVCVSVVFGIGSGAVSVATGLANHSLSVLAVGLGVLADVTGSAALLWRFRAERGTPGQSQVAEVRAAIVVATALAVVSVVITVQAAAALTIGSRPGTSGVTLIAAAISLSVLTPLAYAKRRLGVQMTSRALQGDGTLSGIGAASSLLALTVLLLYHALGWWWADPAAALIVAVVAAAEAWHTAPRQAASPRR